MIKYLKIVLVFICVSIYVFTYANEVEYKYNDGGFKNIQLMGKLKTDGNVLLNEYSYQINLVGSDGLNVTIPKYTPIEERIIKKYGFSRINNLIETKFLSIEGSYLRFNNTDTGLNNLIKVEEKKELKTNMIHRRKFRIESDMNQTIKLKLFTVSPDYYSGTFSRESDENGIPNDSYSLTLFDSNREYYKLQGNIANSNHSGLSLKNQELKIKNDYLTSYDINFKKYYEVFNFKKELKNGDFWNQKSVLPYYEFDIELTKGRNELSLSYMTYHYNGETLQIK